jgi:hypothetical protein
MTKRTQGLRALAVAVSSLGVVIGLTLSIGGIWADLEASLFDRSLGADGRLSSLRCPTIMTASRPSVISATLSNPFDRDIEHNIRVHISEGFVTLMREERATVPLAPGERKTLEWPITADDAAYGRIVFVRAYQFPKYPQPDREASCGVLVLNVPVLSGGQIVGLAFASSLLAMGGGVLLWNRVSHSASKRDQRIVTSMISLGAVVLVTMVATVLGFWIPALALLIVATLMTGGMITHFRFGT